LHNYLTALIYRKKNCIKNLIIPGGGRGYPKKIGSENIKILIWFKFYYFL